MYWLKAIATALAVGLLQLLVLVLSIFAVALAWEWLRRVLRQLSPPPAKPPRDERVLRALRRELRQLQTYCWYLEKAEGRRRSYLGAHPYMSVDRFWPRSGGAPLHFVAQINLRDLRSKDGPQWLPGEGLLLFFVDVQAAAWAVVHEPDIKAVVPATPPVDLPRVNKKMAGYVEKAVYFRRARSWPSWERLKTPASLDEGEAARESLSIAAPPEPTHQIGGFPSCVQGDWMEWEIEMEARGIRPKDFAAWLKTPEAAALEPEVRQWRLLLQIDSDPDVGFQWVDSGTLYYWIREQDARAGDFSGVRMVAQYC